MIKLLMHKDTVVAKFDCSDFFVKSVEIVEPLLMPIKATNNIQHFNSRFTEWKRSRNYPCLPPNFKNPVLKDIGNTYEDINNYILPSVSDLYWFKPEKMYVLWNDINYFTNGMINNKRNVKMLDDMCRKYSDCNSYIKDMFSSKGGYKKNLKYFTKNEINNYCMVKAHDFLNNGFDVYNEIIGNIVSEFLDLKTSQYYILPYKLVNNDQTFIVPTVACETIMQNDKLEFVSAQSLINCGETTKTDIFNYIKKMGFSDQINKMIVLDYLILNSKRDLTNIGFIRNADTLEIINLAPNYGCSHSFGYDIHNGIKNEKSSTFLDTHSRQIELVSNFDFLNIDDLYEAVDVVDAVISYSSMNGEQKDLILNTLKSRIPLLINIASKNTNYYFSTENKVYIAENIKRRFDVDKIIKETGIDPLIEQNKDNLFINFLSDTGKEEFENFLVNEKNIKVKFEKFKQDTFMEKYY